MDNKRNTMRELTEQEKQLINKNLVVLEEDLDYKEKVVLAQQQLTLDTAEISYKKQLKDIKQKINYVEQEVNEYKNSITELKRQLEEGVESK